MSLILQTSELLNSFDSISLPELEAYMLLDRVDCKYVFPAGWIPEILNALGKSYKTLEIETLRVFPYHTTYYDTTDWSFFRQHITERGFRSKVRFRKYEQTGTSFLEVKNRTNKLRTEKFRMAKHINMSDGLDEESRNFINHYVYSYNADLQPVLINRFKRITLAAKTDMERVTIDFDITFNDTEGKSFSLPDVGIIERKRVDFSNRSPLSETLKKMAIYPTGFSKYCLGTSNFYDIPGKSLMKPKLLLINKIQNERTSQLHSG
jgi:hypothetical protein